MPRGQKTKTQYSATPTVNYVPFIARGTLQNVSHKSQKISKKYTRLRLSLLLTQTKHTKFLFFARGA